jgi:hypothetical protein
MYRGEVPIIYNKKENSMKFSKIALLLVLGLFLSNHVEALRTMGKNRAARFIKKIEAGKGAHVLKLLKHYEKKDANYKSVEAAANKALGIGSTPTPPPEAPSAKPAATTYTVKQITDKLKGAHQDKMFRTGLKWFEDSYDTLKANPADLKEIVTYAVSYGKTSNDSENNRVYVTDRENKPNPSLVDIALFLNQKGDKTEIAPNFPADLYILSTILSVQSKSREKAIEIADNLIAKIPADLHASLLPFTNAYLTPGIDSGLAASTDPNFREGVYLLEKYMAYITPALIPGLAQTAIAKGKGEIDRIFKTDKKATASTLADLGLALVRNNQSVWATFLFESITQELVNEIPGSGVLTKAKKYMKYINNVYNEVFLKIDASIAAGLKNFIQTFITTAKAKETAKRKDQTQWTEYKTLKNIVADLKTKGFTLTY